MKLLSLKDLGYGFDHKRIIVWGYDTSLPYEVVYKALRNHFSHCGRITDVYVPRSTADANKLDEFSYISFPFIGKGLDKALLFNGTDIGGWTLYIKPYPYRPDETKRMVWLTVEGFDTSLSEIDIKRELIKLFSSCGAVHEYDVHVFKSGSAELIVRGGVDATQKVLKLDGSFMGQHKVVLRNVCYGQTRNQHPMEMKFLSLEDLGHARPGFSDGRIIVWGYDTSLPKDVVETALRNHFSNCGRITAVYVPPADAEELHDISYIYFVRKDAVDKALLLNGTDVGGWTVYIKPYPFRPDATKRMVWLTVQGFDASFIKSELIQLFSSCGEVDEHDVYVFNSGSADLIVRGVDAAELNVFFMNNVFFMGQHTVFLRNLCYGHLETSKPLRIAESVEEEMKLLSLKDLGYAFGNGRIIVWGYDTSLPKDVVETALRNQFSRCGEIIYVYVPLADAEELHDISYIYFDGKDAVDKALLLNGTDVGGWTVNIKPYPYGPDAKKRMGWVTVEGLDTSLSKTEIKRELIQLFSSCGEVDERDVYVFKSGSADLIVRGVGVDAAEKVLKLDGSFMGQHKVVLRNVCHGHLENSMPLFMGEEEMKLLSLKQSDLQSGYAVPGSGVVGRIIVWGYDTRLPQEVVERALANHFSQCGMITDVCVPMNYGSHGNPADAVELDDISYIYFLVGEGAVDKALLLNGTDVGGWTVYIKPYPFRPDSLKRMVWLTVEGFDTSVSKIEMKRELIQLFSSCGEVDDYDVHVFKSGSAELIVKGEDAAKKVPKLNNGVFMGQYKLVLRNVCYGHIQIDFRCGYAVRSVYAVPGCGEVGRIKVSGYDTKLTQEVVERALANHFSQCGTITDVCVPIAFRSPADAKKLDDVSYIYFVGEGAVAKALDLNGTDVGGGWTVNIKAYPFRPDAKRIAWLNVKCFDTSRSEIEIKRELIQLFSSCGKVNESDVHVFNRGASLIVEGEDAAEKVVKLVDGSFMEQHKLVLRHVCYREIRTVHERLNGVFC